MRLIKIVPALFFSLCFLAVSSTYVDASTKSSHAKNSHKSSSRTKGKKQVAKNTSPGNVWDRIRAGIRIPRPNPTSSFSEIHVVTTNPPDLYQTNKPIQKVQDNNDISGNLTSPNTTSSDVKDKSQIPQKFRIRHVVSPQNSSQLKLESTPENRYTKLGQSIFAAKKPVGESLSEADKGDIKPHDDSSSARGDAASKSPALQRIRSRLGLFKHGENKAAEASHKNTPNDPKAAATASKDQDQINNCGDLKKAEIIDLARQGVLTESYNQMVGECRSKQLAKFARINKHIVGYSRGLLYDVSVRARPYLFHIVDTLNKYKLPLDLALLPIVESAYQSTALSPKSAAGLWQFIPSTGLEYDLEQNELYDARLDVTASTQAAIRFLSGLNAHYKGDWLLSLAAYNSGQGTVDAAINLNRAEGLDTDFWSLDLPAETEDYVPRLLALSTIFANPGTHGLKLMPIKNEPYFVKVSVDRETDIGLIAQKDLTTIAKLANLSPEDFSSLNTAYLSPKLPVRKPYTFLMPINNANHLHKSLTYLAQAKKQPDNQALPIQHELSFSPIINKMNIDMPFLTIAPEEDPFWPFAKKKIDLRAASKTTDDKKPSAQQANAEDFIIHYLESDESLKTLADSHGISEEMLREVNKLKRKQIATTGQRLLIPIQPTISTTTKNPRTSILFQSSISNLDDLNTIL